MSKLTIVLLVILVVLIVVTAVLYFLGKKMEKRQAEQQEQMEATKQTLSMLVIDKKKMKLKEAGFPAFVMENVPKYMRRSKVYVVKAKVGPKIISFMCDREVFDIIPIKKEVKATVSGIYISGVRGVRGSLDTPPEKKGFFSRFKKSK